MRADFKDSGGSRKGGRNRRSGRTVSRAKGSSSRGKKTTSRNFDRQLGWLWMVAGLAIGFFVAFLVHLKNQNQGLEPALTAASAPATQDKSAAKSSSVDKAVVPTPKPQENSEPKEPEYHFYSLLKEQKVEVPDTRVRDARAALVQDRKENLALQVGSFRRFSDAESMKAQLALLGFEAIIDKTETSKHGIWHRVRLGPYSDERVLGRDRARLYSHKIDSLKIVLSK